MCLEILKNTFNLKAYASMFEVSFANKYIYAFTYNFLYKTKIVFHSFLFQVSFHSFDD